MNRRITDGDYATCTPLIWACMQARWHLAVAPLDEDADINAPRYGPRPQDRQRGQTPVWWAASKGRLDMVETFVQRGADAHIPDSHGSTPLHQAASGGHHEIVQYLLRLDCDPWATISDGRTPFDLAATHGRTDVVKLFLDGGHPPDRTEGPGYTALMLACE